MAYEILFIQVRWWTIGWFPLGAIKKCYEYLMSICAAFSILLGINLGVQLLDKKAVYIWT